MSITIRRYIDITSGVAAGAAVAARDLMLRLFHDNPLTPVDAVVEFNSASDVATYYGGSSAEYNQAAFYFGYLSKGLTSPKAISFARYAKTAQAARIYGATTATTLAQFKAITSGSMTLSVGGQNATLTAVDLSPATSLADVAARLQTAIRAAAGSQFTTATVTYDAVKSEFDFVASVAGAAAISVASAGTLAAPFGWASVSTVFSPGVAATPLATSLSASANADNNFGSFAVLDMAATNDEEIAASTWNATRNVEFMFLAPVTSSTAAAVSAATLGNAGTGLTLAPIATQYPHLLPAAILAATDYSRRGSVQNYMFQQANLTASVTNDADADTYDALRVNYYGQTATGGQNISFYQRGLLTGGTTAPVDMNTYANEIWLKDAATVALMSLLLSVGRLPANVEGRASVLSVLAAEGGPVDQALRNGVISVGKTLTALQRAYILEVTGDELAWSQVQNVGYWLDAVVEPYTGPGGTTEYRIVYTLVYSKDDAIRKVEGVHSLI